MNEKEWLAAEERTLREALSIAVTQYDDGQITLAQLHHTQAVLVHGALNKVSDRAYSQGLNDADIDEGFIGDPTFEVDDEDEQENT